MDATSRPEREELELRAHRADEIATKLRELRKTDGWATLVEVFTAARESYFRTLTQKLMRGREIDQRRLDYNRGIFDGVAQLLEQPEKAEAHLRRALTALEEAAEKE